MPRSREFLGAGASSERFKRYEGTTSEVTLGDTLSDVFVFSGHPDKIRLHARTNSAAFVLDDLDGRESDPIHVAPVDGVEVFVPRRRVRGRNLVAGSNAVVSVVGFYAEPSAPFDAR